MKTTKLLSTTALLLASSFFATSANAAVFQIAFDDTFNSTMEGNIVGNGTLSYDGPINTGVFALSELSNLELSIDLFSGEVFNQDNILATDLSGIELNVVRSADTLYATFIGSGGGAGGALDLQNTDNSSIQFLTTESGDEYSGDLGGTNLARSYFTFGATQLSGTYQMTAPVPEPGTIALFGFGLIGIVFARKRLNK